MEKNKVYVQLQTISRSIPLNTSDEKQHIDNMTWELTQKELRILEWVGTDSGELKKKKKKHLLKYYKFLLLFQLQS